MPMAKTAATLLFLSLFLMGSFGNAERTTCRVPGPAKSPARNRSAGY